VSAFGLHKRISGHWFGFAMKYQFESFGQQRLHHGPHFVGCGWTGGFRENFVKAGSQGAGIRDLIRTDSVRPHNYGAQANVPHDEIPGRGL
jgi:hypothetical protein